MIPQYQAAPGGALLRPSPHAQEKTAPAAPSKPYQTDGPLKKIRVAGENRRNHPNDERSGVVTGSRIRQTETQGRLLSVSYDEEYMRARSVNLADFLTLYRKLQRIGAGRADAK